MSKDEKALLEDFRKMTPENKAHFLTLAHNTRSTQETTKKSLAKTRTTKKAVPAKKRKSA